MRGDGIAVRLEHTAEDALLMYWCLIFHPRAVGRLLRAVLEKRPAMLASNTRWMIGGHHLVEEVASSIRPAVIPLPANDNSSEACRSHSFRNKQAPGNHRNIFQHHHSARSTANTLLLTQSEQATLLSICEAEFEEVSRVMLT